MCVQTGGEHQIQFSSDPLAHFLSQAPVSRKAQTLNYINGYAVPGEKTTGLKPAAPMAPNQMVSAEAPPSTLPAWVAYDRKVSPGVDAPPQSKNAD